MNYEKEITFKKKELLENNDESNPIMAEVNRVKDLRVQAMGIKDVMKVDDSKKEMMVKDTPATQIIKKEVQGVLKIDKKVKKDYDFLE